MKMVVKGFIGALAVLAVAGCIGVYVPPVPADMQTALNDYYKQPGHKVFVVATDANGDYTFAYDYGKASVKEAAEVATINCDEARKKMNVLSKPVVYAVDNKVVYKNLIHSNQKK